MYNDTICQKKLFIVSVKIVILKMLCNYVDAGKWIMSIANRAVIEFIIPIANFYLLAFGVVAIFF